MVKTDWLLLVLMGLVFSSIERAEGRKTRILEGSSYELAYSAINCRKHSASIKDFGGVGDGKTLNTKAFQEAVNQLSQYASDGGSQLIVPAGQWLTGSFNLTSHFTLFLQKDAVLLASQVLPFFFKVQFHLFSPFHFMSLLKVFSFCLERYKKIYYDV